MPRNPRYKNCFVKTTETTAVPSFSSLGALSNSETRQHRSVSIENPLNIQFERQTSPNNPNSNSQPRAAVYDFRFTTSCGRGRTRSELPAIHVSAIGADDRNAVKTRSMAEPTTTISGQFKGAPKFEISKWYSLLADACRLDELFAGTWETIADKPT